MAVSIADDDLFTRAVSGYRDAFWDRNQHLSEAERNIAWTQRLSQFMTDGNASTSKTSPGPSPDILGKRTRQTPRTVAEASSVKRRAPVCFDSSPLFLAPGDLTFGRVRNLPVQSEPSRPSQLRPSHRWSAHKVNKFQHLPDRLKHAGNRPSPLCTGTAT